MNSGNAGCTITSTSLSGVMCCPDQASPPTSAPLSGPLTKSCKSSTWLKTATVDLQGVSTVVGARGKGCDCSPPYGQYILTEKSCGDAHTALGQIPGIKYDWDFYPGTDIKSRAGDPQWPKGCSYGDIYQPRGLRFEDDYTPDQDNIYVWMYPLCILSFPPA